MNALKAFFQFSLPHKQREEIANGILRFVLPVLGVGAAVSGVAVLVLMPDQLFRALPSLLALIVLFPIWFFRNRGEPLKSATIFIWLAIGVLTFAMIRSGGVYAPIFAAGIVPVLTCIVVFQGTKKGFISAVYFITLAVIIALLQKSGHLEIPPREESLYLVIIHLIWLFLAGTIIIVPMRILYRLLKESKQQQEKLVDMQNELVHSQKMQALGQLASGVAHDFNNLLTGIVGYSELMLLEIEDPEMRQGLETIAASVYRASELTSQLLTFSRNDIIETKPLDLHRLIIETEALLKRTLSKEIVLLTNLEATESVVEGSESHIQNVLMNLCINSSHAIDGCGTIAIRTSIVELEKAQNELAPGNYLSLTISDTGSGISEENLEHIFDPFFTTKEKGKGTGLGLSSVYGTIIQHGGDISVESKVGVGTMFTILLPYLEGVHINEPESIEEESDQVSAYTVLVIDDDLTVRMVTQQILERYGYSVLLASDGEEGVELFRERRNEIDAVVLDMVMPRLNGIECFRIFRTEKPEIPIVIITGIVTSADVELVLREGAHEVLSKPFSRDGLLTALSNVLPKK